MLTMRAGTRRRIALLLRTLGAAVVIGAVVGGANGFGFRDAPLLGAMLGAFGGATNGVILMGAILGAEILLPPTRLGHALERVQFLVTFAMKFLVYGTLIVLVVGRPGGRLVRAVAAMLLSPDLAQATYVQRAPRAVLMASIFLLLGNAIFVLQMGRLVGVVSAPARVPALPVTLVCHPAARRRPALARLAALLAIAGARAAGPRAPPSLILTGVPHYRLESRSSRYGSPPRVPSGTLLP